MPRVWRTLDAFVPHVEEVPVTPEDVEDLKLVTTMTATGRARELREGIGMSGAAGGAFVGVHQSTFRRWEDGALRPRLEHARRYAALLRLLDGQAA